ncbi:hypothetical protein L1889_15625 [Paenalcaligenes niemegkensis]|uniref:AtuA-related protein n=1 Tax=Paenalcaligenes niemegkensis TaxID=2895469 RepID=UPI001EE7FBD7|nr:hypothetical protein [Paenalcaligenes niemegkensis]MCQ9617924.1 hypothetical protein [Paenalcaligenes niemegkensis]
MSGSDLCLDVPLYRLAHSRTGDKGDVSSISVIAWDTDCYLILLKELTEERVAAWFADRKPMRVSRYELPGLQAFNLVLEGVLDGGVNHALNLDTHGKGLSFHLLDMPVTVPKEMLDTLRDIRTTTSNEVN